MCLFTSALQEPESRALHTQDNGSAILSYTLSPNFCYCLSDVMNVIWHLENKTPYKVG